MEENLKILLLEDSDVDAEIVSRLLRKEVKPQEIKLAYNKETFLNGLDEFKPDVIIADNSLPQFSATEALEIIRQRMLIVPFILVTGTVSEEFAAGIIKLGADDYILKDRLARLPSAIDSALKQRRSAKEKLEAQQNLIRSEEKYRTQIERISDAFISLDENFNYTYVNQQAGELVHRDPQSLIGKNVWEEFPDAVGTATYRDFTNAMIEQRYITNIDYFAPLDLWQENHIYPSAHGLSVFIKDITVKKRAELALKNSEEVRRLIMNSSLDAIVCTDVKAFITVWNPQAEKMFGWTEPAMLGQPFFEKVIPPQCRPNHLQALDQFLKTGQLSNPKSGEPSLLGKVFEVSALHRDGKIFPIELAIVALNQNGVDFFCAFIRDITFRKEAEQKLKQSEEKYRTLVEQAFDGIIIYALDGTIIDFNQSAYAYMGYTKAEFQKLQVKDLFFREELVKKPLSFSRLKAGNTTLDYRRLKKKDGNFVEMEIGTKMLPNGNLMAIARDITERKKAEEEIRLSNERYKAVAKATSDAIWDYDFASNKTFIAGTGYKALFGYDLVDQYSEDGFWENRLHPDDKQKILGDLAVTINDASISQSDSEYRFLKADGTYAWVCDRLFIIRDNGRPIRMLGAKQDITEQKKANEKIQNSFEEIRQLASHLQEVREEERAAMAREVHDELGQQLTGLKMDISWLNKKLVGGDPLITNKIKDTIVLLDDAVKTVRKIATELRPSILDDLGLVAALEWQCDEFRKKSGINISFMSVPFDRIIPENFGIALFRILQESLTNIARHSQANNITVQLNVHADQLFLDIKDDGVGFVTSNVAGKKTLGLLGMKERTMMIGGSYRIDSEPGKGASVHVVVPLPNT